MYIYIHIYSYLYIYTAAAAAAAAAAAETRGGSTQDVRSGCCIGASERRCRVRQERQQGRSSLQFTTDQSGRRLVCNRRPEGGCLLFLFCLF